MFGMRKVNFVIKSEVTFYKEKVAVGTHLSLDFCYNFTGT